MCHLARNAHGEVESTRKLSRGGGSGVKFTKRHIKFSTVTCCSRPTSRCVMLIEAHLQVYSYAQSCSPLLGPNDSEVGSSTPVPLHYQVTTPDKLFTHHSPSLRCPNLGKMTTKYPNSNPKSNHTQSLYNIYGAFHNFTIHDTIECQHDMRPFV